MIRAINTVAYVGLLRPAPGTWGSLAALGLAYLICLIGGPFLLLLLTVAVIILGIWTIGQQITGQPDQDPSEIVIDEVAGQWIALLPVAFGGWHAGVPLTALWPGWIAAFMLFRLFDIWKPGPVGWADRRGGASGVMLDDVIAGLFAGLGVMAMAGIYHGLLT
jgi:phosphatidylglycerophosphatase A